MDREPGKRPLRYHSFILTLWTEGGGLPNAPPVWRISLQDPHTAQRHGFTDVAELARFLQEWTAVPPAEKSDAEK